MTQITLRTRSDDSTRTQEIPDIITRQTYFSSTGSCSELVARKSELEDLKSALTIAEVSFGSTVTITGEGGVGKSRLVEEFIDTISGKNLIVLKADCSDNQSAHPYSPFLDALKKLLDPSITIDNSLKTFLRLIIGSFEGVSFEESQNNNIIASDIYRIQRGICEVLTRTSEDRPVVLVLDNFHQADQSSCQLFHYLARAAKTEKLLIIAALRKISETKNIEEKSYCFEVLERMSKEKLYREIKLTRFDLRSTRDLIIHCFPKSDFSSDFLPTIYEATGGNPLYLVKELKYLVDQEKIFLENDIWYNQKIDYSKVENLGSDISRMLRKNLESQLNRFSEKEKWIIKYAALLGYSFEADILAKALKTELVLLSRFLQNTQLSTNLIRSQDGKYWFDHPLIRETILSDISPDQRKKMHLKIAEAVKEIASAQSNKLNYLMAYHLYEAEDWQQAYPFLRRAGDIAYSTYAFWEASRFYQKALKAIHKIEGHEKLEHDCLHLSLQKSKIDFELGNLRDSLQLCNDALDLSMRLNENDKRAEALIQLGLHKTLENEWTEAIQCYRKSRKLLPVDDSFNGSRVMLRNGNVYFELGYWKRAKKCYAQGLDLAQDSGVDKQIAEALLNMGVLACVTGDRKLAIHYYTKCIPIYDKAGDSFRLAMIYHNLGMAHADGDDWKRADEFYRKSLTISDKLGMTPLKMMTFLSRAITLLALNEIDTAKEYNTKAREILNIFNDKLSLAEYEKVQGMIEREEGYFEESAMHFQNALDLFVDLDNKLGIAEVQYEIGLMYHSSEQYHESIFWLKNALKTYRYLRIMDKVHRIERHLNKKGDTYQYNFSTSSSSG